jgi:hypothetical protein
MTWVVLEVLVSFGFNPVLEEASARSHARVGSRLRLPKSEPAYLVLAGSASGAAPQDWRSGKQQSVRLTLAVQSILEVWGSGAY